uniref:Phosphorylase b kinase regulatory subunit n=1 Tax=Lepeophtheirus salmonis TaxID=72036 RepID=A0A0K2TG70_LEPSM
MDSASYKRQRKGSVIISKERKVSNPLLVITSAYDESLLKYQSQESASNNLPEADIVLIELNYYYGLAKRQLIKYQSPFTGLFPATSTTKNIGSVKESIYCAMSIWSLHIAYRNLDFDKGKGTELRGHVVNCLRGIMTCWMKQAHKIEAFKKNQSPENSLHSKFNIETGEPIFSSEEYHHLQVNVVSLYILFICQVISSGFVIIYSMEEVCFIQNLVYYIERAYRIPDYGVWERGSKFNDGTRELHASSIGMAKAALESINGFNLMGINGTSRTVIYSDIDAHNRNRNTYEAILPRESDSRSVDIGLLPVLTFPAFATHNGTIYEETKDRIMNCLEGKFGFIRFYRDGYLTENESDFLLPNEQYPPGTIQEFQGVEAQWPIFFIFFIIEGIFKKNEKQIEKYQLLLRDRIIYESHDDNQDPYLPAAYVVPTLLIEEEKKAPGTQNRIPSKNGSSSEDVFLWGQSMLIIVELLTNNLIEPFDIDPIRRSLPSRSRPRQGTRHSTFEGTTYDSMVQVAMISESIPLKELLATYGIESQTPDEIEPIQIWSHSNITKIYSYLGENRKLNLSGRPNRPIGILGSSKVYKINGITALCYPLIFSASEFYLSYDMAILTDDILNELSVVSRRWKLCGRPTFCILILEDHMRDQKFSATLLGLLSNLRNSDVNGVRLRFGKVQSLIETSCVEHLDFLPEKVFESLNIQPLVQKVEKASGFSTLLSNMKKQSTTIKEEYRNYVDLYRNKSTHDIACSIQSCNNMYGNIQMLGLILRRDGPDYCIDGHTVKKRLQKLNETSGSMRYWAAMRYSSSLLEQMVESISPYITAILVSGKQVVMGMGSGQEILIDKPIPPSDILNILYREPHYQFILRTVLQQEIIVEIGKSISSSPHLYTGILKLRIQWILKAVQHYIDMKKLKVPNQTQEAIETISPSRLRHAFLACLGESRDLQIEFSKKANKEYNSRSLTLYEVRTINGCLLRVPPDFYDTCMWLVLQRTSGGVYFGNTHIPQTPTINYYKRTDSRYAHIIESALHQLRDNNEPAFLQLVIEFIYVLYIILMRSPEVIFGEKLCVETIVREACDLYGKDGCFKTEIDILQKFCSDSVTVTAGYMVRAVINKIVKGSMFERVGTSERKTLEYNCGMQ